MTNDIKIIVEELESATTVKSIMILQGGVSIFSDLDNRGKYNLRSLSKLLVEVAIGFAEKDKLLSINDKITRFFPEYWFNNSLYCWEDVSISNLLNMTVGIKKPLLNGFPCKEICESDFIKYVFSFPLTYKPGDAFLYNNACYFILSAILQKQCVLRLDSYLDSKLFSKLGIGDYSWDVCDNGIIFGASNLFMSHENYIAFASVILSNGCYRGDKLIPDVCLDRIFHGGTLPYNSNSKLTLLKKRRYGSGTWKTDSDIIYSLGKDGQCCVFCPKESLIVSMISSKTDSNIILGFAEKIIRTFSSYSS